tara:strand:- start:158 stop:385 length:228 start_codon:yes stop_codon:yes gene_type:complete
MADKYYIDAPTYLEITSDIADYVMRARFAKDYDDCIHVEQGIISYSDMGQEIFNRYLDQIQIFFSNANIVNKENE